jgi:hypothetical protein
MFVAPRRRGRALVVVLVSVVFLLSGAAATLYLYGRATEPDRGTPDVAVDQFINAALVERDPVRTSLFVCEAWPPAEAIQQATSGVDATVSVTWSAISVSLSGSDTASAVVDVTYTVAGFSDVETWSVEVKKENGWRVCGLTRTTLTRPTPSPRPTPQSPESAR